MSEELGDGGRDGQAFLKLVELRKAYAGAIAVDGVSIAVNKGEFVTLLGPSGCGKTTTLRMIAGFIEPDSGHITLAGRNIEHVPTHRRGAAMVFQNYALFPHMTVFENVAFGLRMQKVAEGELRRRVGESLDLVRLAHLAARYPKQLSGGQQQRVALARAVVLNPKLLLLDEPLSNLDAKLRKELRSELLDIHRLSHITTIFVTHDLEEAFSLSDRVAVMSAGRLEQYGTPVEIFNHPQSAFVADFVGHTNVLEGSLQRSASDGSVVGCGDLVIRVDFDAGAGAQPVQIAIPGHTVRVALEPHRTDNDFEATIERMSFIGPRLLLRLAIGAHTLDVELPATRNLQGLREGTVVHAGWNRGDVVLVPSAAGPAP